VKGRGASSKLVGLESLLDRAAAELKLLPLEALGANGSEAFPNRLV